ncbi:AMP-binding protein [Acrocarpospora catenulata]|uniref:AMP-binding protein n=1 Tax=Acrocarpospora catenulata TaxID=2836182 RepID=UPI001BD9BBA2|nr:AMP-binding protein [Acrocarpospora catenulata]
MPTRADPVLIEESERVALGVAGGPRLSYRQLGQLVRVLADRFAEAGIGRAGPVAIYCDNRPEFVLALLAAWAAGVAAVPIDPQLSGAETGARLAAAGAGDIVLPRHLRDSYPGDACPAWVIDIDAERGEVAVTGIRPGEAAQGRDHDPDLALLMFTTGSTGTAKIVPLSHANLAASVDGIVSTYRLGPGDATLVVMPLYHGHGLVAGLLATLASGGAVYLPAAGRFSAHRFWDEIVDAKATWYTAVPTVHQILLARAVTDYPAAAPPALRFIRSSSAPLAPSVLRRTEERFHAPMIPAYGMTETSHQAASNPLPRDGVRKDTSVGVPTGLHVRIVTSDGKPAGIGETGEVCVRGPALTKGYFRDPQATAAAFVDGWFHTGDLGHLDADGYLFLSGRIKDMINRGGEKIAPQTVEAALLSHPAVQDALAFPVPDAKYGEEVNSAVVLRPGRHASQDELREHCRGRLAAFEIPKKIYFLDRFPRTTKGDVDRRALRSHFTDTR